MPRKYKPLPDAYRRTDPRYHNVVASKFINSLMCHGRKTAATKVFYGTIEAVRVKTKDNQPPIEAIDVFLRAIENVRPHIETKSRRVGGATYQVPVQIRPKRALALAMKWIIGAARGKKGRPMYQRLADEVLAAWRNEGEAVKKREDTHKMAESNRAFAHLAF